MLERFRVMGTFGFKLSLGGRVNVGSLVAHSSGTLLWHEVMGCIRFSHLYITACPDYYPQESV